MVSVGGGLRLPLLPHGGGQKVVLVVVDQVFYFQGVRHLVQPQVERIVGLGVAFGEVLPGKHNGPCCRVHLALVVLLGDGGVVVIWINQDPLEVLQHQFGQAKG